MGPKLSTGLAGLDTVINHLRVGDNVVWQVDSIADLQPFVTSYVEQAKQDGRKIVYMRFADHAPQQKRQEQRHSTSSGPRLNAQGILEQVPVTTGLGNWQFTEIVDGLENINEVVLSVDRAGVVAGAEAMAAAR